MSKKPLVPEAKQKLNKFKLEVAEDLNIDNATKEAHIDKGYMGDITSKEAGHLAGGSCGNLGGKMIRKIIEEEEHRMANNSFGQNK